MNKIKVATLGPKGSFSEEAASNLYPSEPILLLGSMQEVYDSVVSGKTDIGVLPYYNSIADVVQQAREIINFEVSGNSVILNDRKIRKVAETFLPIRLNLITLDGVSLEEIIQVITHPKAAEQCSGFLKKMGVDVVTSYFENGQRRDYSTSEAARYVSEEGCRQIAAVSSANVTKYHKNLKIAVPDIQNGKNNRTYFMAFQKS